MSRKKAEAANKAKTDFLENMRHDIRTALTGIVGLSELLTTETDIQTVHVFSRELVKSSHELLRFLNEILESIQVSSGDIQLLNQPLCLRDILKSVLNLHQPMAIQKQLTLALEIDNAIPNCLLGDPVRIYRITLELLANALKFTPTGSVNIFAALVKQEGQTAIVKILIQDTGIGIAQDKQSELFIRFNRLTPSYEGIYKGMGLGLSIVKQFVEDLKGEIYVESHLNEGSQFVFILPLKVSLLEELENTKFLDTR